MVCLGDMPLVTGRLIDRMIAAYDADEGRAIVLPTHQGRSGNPILWDRLYFPKSSLFPGDVGARGLLKRHGAGGGSRNRRRCGAAGLRTVDSLATLPAAVAARRCGAACRCWRWRRWPPAPTRPRIARAAPRRADRQGRGRGAAGVRPAHLAATGRARCARSCMSAATWSGRPDVGHDLAATFPCRIAFIARERPRALLRPARRRLLSVRRPSGPDPDRDFLDGRLSSL